MESKIMAKTKKKEGEDDYRSKKKKKGFYPRSYQFQKDVCDTIDRIKEETGINKDDIVAEAIKSYAKSNYKKATEKITTVSSREFNQLKKILNLLIEEYLVGVYEWGKEEEEEEIEDMVSNLEAKNKEYEEMMKEEFFNKHKKKLLSKFTTIGEFRLFLYTYIKNGKDKKKTK